jgi:hypothetical protein
MCLLFAQTKEEEMKLKLEEALAEVAGENESKTEALRQAMLTDKQAAIEVSLYVCKASVALIPGLVSALGK